MTDTTDTAALREQAETAKACGGMFAISGEKALSLLDQLEAERQRAEDALILIGYAEDGKGFVYEPRHQDRISNPIAIYRRKES